MRDIKKMFWINLVIVVGLIAIVTIRSVTGDGPGTDFVLSADGLTISGPDNFSASIEFKDVVSIEFREEFDRGRCITGGNEGKITYGIWENDEFGEYSLYVLTKVDACMILEGSGGDIIVFNIENAKNTQAFTENLIEYLQGKGYLSP